MKDLKKEYPVLEKDEYHRRMKSKNQGLILDSINGVLNFILKIIFR
ncbi:hypothetical protein KP77_30370 [Jeotgalibacillus alimentarius]|uniref:Uncharacterized protein n=1 Tax=Jeotgalibacillus alimentarius TaxID=135826 RepID=A0A0C2VFM3_9BACL|nr:hypothetical protein [Jeotgalibacillus alimentarius]KIL43331.1 hypothetical protein KP77_30370 [Jeotgalibacillus alimentarius]